MKAKIFLMIVSLLCACNISNASDYWYRTDVEYYKITTKHNGIAKISIDTLLNLNPQLKNRSANGLLLLYCGELEPFYYCDNDKSNETISAGDYILFLGKHAGTDTSYNNEWTDEAVFYLYYDENAAIKLPENSRLKLYEEPDNYTDIINEVYISQHFEKDSYYYLGVDPYDYDKSRFEGWYWKRLKDYPGGQDNTSTTPNNGRLVINFPFYPVSGEIEISAKITTIDVFPTSLRKVNMVLNPDPTTGTAIVLDSTILSISFNKLCDSVMKKSLPAEDLKEGENTLEIINLTDEKTDIETAKSSYIGVDYIEIKGMSKPYAYQQNNGMMADFEISSLTNNSLLQIAGWTNPEIIILDTISKSILSKTTTTDKLEFNVSASPNKQHFIINDFNSIEIAKISKAKNTNYKNITNSAEVILIYNKEFEAKSLEYSEYRANQGYKVFNADVEEIYKEFNYGSKTPNAIKDFLQFAYENWTHPVPKYVILIGDASTDTRQCDTLSKAVDYVPTYGNPASDYWYGAFNLYDPEHKAEMIVGRIPISTNTMLDNYLIKVKNYENQNVAKWNKRFLFINGGGDESERNNIKQDAMYVGSFLDFKPLCADTTMISRDDNDGPTTFSKQEEIKSAVNNGAMFTIFSGHGAVDHFDVQGWNVDVLNNNNKFGILSTFSCNTGDFANTKEAVRINEEYIIKCPDKGYIAALGATTPTVLSVNIDLLFNFVNEMINQNGRCIGDLLENAKRNIKYYTGQWPEIMRFNFGILGDPLIRVKIDTVPDFYINANEAKITAADGSSNISENNDIINVEYYIGNAGTAYDGKYSVGVEHYWNGLLIGELHNEKYNLYKGEYFNFTLPVKSKPGEHIIVINVDEYEQANENDRTNNLCTLKINVFNSSLLPVEPLPNWSVQQHNPPFRFINPLGNMAFFEYEFQILIINDNDTTLIKTSDKNEIQLKENCIDWMPNVELSANNNYILQAKINTNNPNILMQVLNLPFNTFNNNDDIPVAELAVIWTQCSFNTDPTMRGDTLIFTLAVENLSMRTHSIPATISVIIEKQYSSDTFYVSLPEIKINENIKIEIPISTDYSEYSNLIVVNIDPVYINNELYTFNNSYQNNFYVNEDEIPPTLTINFDGTLIQNKDYISKSSLIEIELQDNSNLPVTTNNPITLKINAMPQSINNTEAFSLFTDYPKGSKTKAKLTIRPKELTENENYFAFSGTDASGNTTTEIYYLYISLNNFVENLLTFPNPANSSDDFLNFKFYWQSSLTNANAEINIYSANGTFVKTITQPLKIRDNYILWDMKDNTGKLISSGTYYYEVRVSSEYWTPTAFGKFVFIND